MKLSEYSHISITEIRNIVFLSRNICVINIVHNNVEHTESLDALQPREQ